MTPDDKGELNAEQIAQEFNRRAWRGRGDWRKMTPNGYLQGEHLETSNGDIVPINDSRALVLGWQAMEELAKARQRLSEMETSGIVEVEYFKVRAERDRLQTQLAALTAENERLSGKLTDAADTIRILHREKREDADVSEAEAIRLSTKIERLREPAEGTWGWALVQMKAGKAVKRPMQPDNLALVCDRVLREQGLLDIYRLVWTGGPTLATIPSIDYEATDWQIADEGSES